MKTIDIFKQALGHSYLIVGLLLCMLILGCTGCSNPAEPKGNLVGNITIDGLTDYSGATVALYNIVSPDTTLARINQEFPLIGITPSQRTEFDIREHSPIKTTTTSADGRFSISGISEGTYNVVIRKNGYGFKVFYGYEVSPGTDILNSAATNALITLYPETTLTSLVTTSMTFLTDHQYIINGDVSFDPSTSVIIQPGAVIRINPSNTLRFFGQVSLHGDVDNFIQFTSNDGYDAAKGLISGDRTIVTFNSVRFEAGSTVDAGSIEGCSVTHSENGLISYAVCNVKNSLFENAISSFTINSILGDVTVENCIFRNSLELENGAVYMNSINNLTFQKNIVYNNNVGMYLRQISDGIIKDNYYQNNNQIAMRLEFYCNPDINHNIISKSAKGINISQNCQFTISYNKIWATLGIYMEGSYNYIPVTNNNMVCTQLDVMYYNRSAGPLTAINNYWGKITDEEIAELIYDKLDMDPGSPWIDDMNVVNYIPYRTTPLNTAGVEH